MTRHSAYLHRASTATVNKLVRALDTTSGSMMRDIHDRLDNLTPAELMAFSRGKYTTSRLKGLRATIDGWARALGEQIDAEFTADARALAGHEANFARRLIGASGAASERAAFDAAMATPVLGEFISTMLSDIPDRAQRQVYATIRQGIAQGQPNDEIIRAIRGTKQLRYKDGILQASRNAIETAVRTARAHISNETYLDQWESLGVEALVWVASLELRTCVICAGLDGKEYAIVESFARPPLHPRCRCAVIPKIDDEMAGKRPFVLAGKVTGRDGESGFRPIGKMTQRQREDAGLKIGQVSAKTSFSQWFDRQPDRFKREWLGPTKFKLYKDGGYKLDRFVDPRNKPYTINELRQRDSETFKEVFG